MRSPAEDVWDLLLLSGPRCGNSSARPRPLHSQSLCCGGGVVEMLRFLSSGHFWDRDGLRSFLLRCILMELRFCGNSKSNVPVTSRPGAPLGP